MNGPCTDSLHTPNNSRHIGISIGMLRHMRTTVILPDELYRQVKDRARADDATFTSFLETALRRELARRDRRASGPVDVHLAPATGSGGVRPGVDLSSGAALLEVMEEGQPFEKLR